MWAMVLRGAGARISERIGRAWVRVCVQARARGLGVPGRDEGTGERGTAGERL